MNRRYRYLYLITTAILAANLLAVFQVYSARAREAGDDEGYRQVRQFIGVLKLIQRNYVDESKVAYDDLVYGAMRGMLSSLDRFSSFIPPHEYEEMREETEGEFGGIGVVISVKDDVLTIVAPMAGSPGMRAGLQANDQIIRVGDKETADLPLSEAVGLIKGEPGTEVKLTIYRPATDKTFDVALTRAIIEIDTVRDVRHLADDVSYLRLTQFNEKTADNLLEVLERERQRKFRGLILDLRNNPGGLLTSAIDVCSFFIGKDKLIVFTEGNRQHPRQNYNSLPGEKFNEPIVILVNEGSASGAEIVAGCLQDYDRAVLVGETSFGKGSVQTIIELDDGSAVRLTTSKYYTPSERVIHGHGITPDVIVDISDQESAKLQQQLARPDNGIQETGDLKDVQLDRGLEIMHQLLEHKGDAADAVRAVRGSTTNTEKRG